MLIVEIIRIHHSVLIGTQASQLLFIAFGIFLQRLIQRHKNDIAAGLLFSFGYQFTQAVLFAVGQLIRIIENPLLRSAFRIGALCLRPGPGNGKYKNCLLYTSPQTSYKNQIQESVQQGSKHQEFYRSA